MALPLIETPEEMQEICRRLSVVLTPWTYPAGQLRSHLVTTGILAANATENRHSHRFYEGFVILDGSVALQTPWETQTLSAGSVAVFSPGAVHQWQTREHTCRWLVLSFDLDHPLITPTRYRWPVCEEVLWSVRMLLDTVRAEPPGWALRANSHLGVIYATLLSLIEPANSEKPASQALTQPQLVTRINEMLTTHLAAPLTLDVLAAEVSMSARHLTRRFFACTGMTVHQRLNMLRMEQAAQLLSRTSLPISEVARAVGISNAAYFAELFRRHFEVSPSRFRARGSDTARPCRRKTELSSPLT